ncbi:MAG: hypothetical protein ABIP55_07900 [Tepidisphaeraceae bacterium]
MTQSVFRGLIGSVVAICMACAVFAITTPSPDARTAAEIFAPIPDAQHLHNAHFVTDKLISGAQPEGEQSFKRLHKLGVKSIISVDGATPDVATAKKYQMRYVHLPIGYDGVDRTQGKAIAKAIGELPGKIYLHCHHGKHRSAAATAVACVYNGSLKPEQAEGVLRTFGTGLNYKGLWKDAKSARPLDPAELRALKIEFVEIARINDLADSMVKLDGHFDNVKAIRKSGWRSPANHPDVDPAHELLQVQEHFHEAGRLGSTAARPANFRTMLRAGETAARSLGQILSAAPVDPPAADKAFNQLAQSCTSCHTAYRD